MATTESAAVPTAFKSAIGENYKTSYWVAVGVLAGSHCRRVRSDYLGGKVHPGILPAGSAPANIAAAPPPLT